MRLHVDGYKEIPGERVGQVAPKLCAVFGALYVPCMRGMHYCSLLAPLLFIY